MKLYRPHGARWHMFRKIGMWTVGIVFRLELRTPRCAYVRERKRDFRVWLPFALTFQQGRGKYRGVNIIMLFVGVLMLGVVWRRKKAAS